MKHRDHRLLGQYLLSIRPEQWREEGQRRAFLVGCVLPDYNPFTYLRGIAESRRMVGHNARYSEKHIEKVAHRLQRKGIRGVADAYALGTLIHYLADSFTYVHTESFREGMREHNRYERELRNVFPILLMDQLRHTPPAPVDDLLGFLKTERVRYDGYPKSMKNDAIRILRVCAVVFCSICREKWE